MERKSSKLFFIVQIVRFAATGKIKIVFIGN